jgi:hypothetical protein
MDVMVCPSGTLVRLPNAPAWMMTSSAAVSWGDARGPTSYPEGGIMI